MERTKRRSYNVSINSDVELYIDASKTKRRSYNVSINSDVELYIDASKPMT
jgi:hypothetical protein